MAQSRASMAVVSPFEKAVKQLPLSPQEQYLYYHHLNNLYGPGKVINPDNSISTVEQAVVYGPGSKYYNIPTVWNGQKLSVPETQMLAGQVGWDNFPSYVTPEEADLRYQSMHDFLNEDTEQWQRTRR